MESRQKGYVSLVPTNSPTVSAIVVTHNRRELLEQCLDRIERQSRRPDHVLVVDCASTDDTADVLARRAGIEVLGLDENLGGAGGFAAGLRVAHERGYDWLWLLDDDTFADDRCLEELLAGAIRAPQAPSIMASVVRWRDGRLHPMNRPWLRAGARPDFVDGAAAGLALIRTSTFVSTMIHRDAIAAHGYPPAHYFVWLDDMEYTGRILRRSYGYIAPESVVTHWTPQPYNSLTESRGRFYYKARNHLWLLRGESFGGRERATYAWGYVRAIWTYLRGSEDRASALRTALRGIRDGLRREPR
jgi:GT2 family glycosyltransferase